MMKGSKQMITQTLQEEKQAILKLLEHILSTVDNLQFLKGEDFEVGKEFKNKWEVKIKNFSYIINNYLHYEFPIVVIGRWNSGKSTLINAILGEEILPSANKEMTSLLTKVCFGDSKDAIVHFSGGGHKTIQISEVENYINLRGSKYSERIKLIDVKCKNSLLRGGFCILDTPGLGSINDLNNDIAFDVIPKAHSIILVFSGSDVGGKDNLNLIEYILTLNCENLSNVIFVINKCDVLSKKETKEAQESLKELIDIARERAKMKQETEDQICMLSAYNELKYKQYYKHAISETELLSDDILKLSSVNQIQLIHQKSNFDEFNELLEESILKSRNKKNIMDRLFTTIQSVLTDLLMDYNSTYAYINKSNNSTKKQFLTLLQKKEDIEFKINREALEKISMFNSKIDVLQPYKEYSMQHVNKLVDSIHMELCKYIEKTPYEEISKNEYRELNQQINIISTRLSINWMGDIRKEFDSEWDEMIITIAKIIEKNNKEISDELLQGNLEEIQLEIDGVRVKENLTVTNHIQSLVTSVSVGSGLFVIGNGLLPGIGGILSSVVGGLIVYIVSWVNQTTEDKRKAAIMKRLKEQLLKYEDMYRRALEDLYLQYVDRIKQLKNYLNTSLENVKQEKECLVKNYDIIKDRNKEIEDKMITDIKAIEELMSQINLVYDQHAKSVGNNF